jgi:hypothetical protein
MLRGMMKRVEGRIVNISSSSGTTATRPVCCQQEPGMIKIFKSNGLVLSRGITMHL